MLRQNSANDNLGQTTEGYAKEEENDQKDGKSRWEQGHGHKATMNTIGKGQLQSLKREKLL